MEAVTLATIPDVPHERPVMEQLAVFLEKAVAKPVVEVAFRPDAVRIQHPQQPVGRGVFTANRRDADDAVVVLELRQFARTS